MSRDVSAKWRQVRAHDIRQARWQRHCRLDFADLDEAWTAHTSAGPLQKMIDTVGPDSARQVVDAVLEADRKPDGALRQDNVMRYVLTTKP